MTNFITSFDISQRDGSIDIRQMIVKSSNFDLKVRIFPQPVSTFWLSSTQPGDDTVSSPPPLRLSDSLYMSEHIYFGGQTICLLEIQKNPAAGQR